MVIGVQCHSLRSSRSAAIIMCRPWSFLGYRSYASSGKSRSRDPTMTKWSNSWRINLVRTRGRSSLFWSTTSFVRPYGAEHLIDGQCDRHVRIGRTTRLLLFISFYLYSLSSLLHPVYRYIRYMQWIYFCQAPFIWNQLFFCFDVLKFLIFWTICI